MDMGGPDAPFWGENALIIDNIYCKFKAKTAHNSTQFFLEERLELWRW